MARRLPEEHAAQIARLIALARSASIPEDAARSVTELLQNTTDETLRTVAMDCLPEIVRDQSDHVKRVAVARMAPFLERRRPRNRAVHAIRALSRIGAPALAVLPKLWAVRRGPFGPMHRIHAALENIAWSGLYSSQAGTQILGLRLLIRNAGPRYCTEERLAQLHALDLHEATRAELAPLGSLASLSPEERMHAWPQWTTTHPLVSSHGLEGESTPS